MPKVKEIAPVFKPAEIEEMVGESKDSPTTLPNVVSSPFPASVMQRFHVEDDNEEPARNERIVSNLDVDERLSDQKFSLRTGNRVHEDTDPIAKGLGSPIYLTDARFDWCLQYENGPRHSFSKYYLEKRVLVDIFDKDSDGIREISLQKALLIDTYNKAHKDARIGYIPYILGEPPSEKRIKHALNGGVCKLPTRRIDPEGL